MTPFSTDVDWETSPISFQFVELVGLTCHVFPVGSAIFSTSSCDTVVEIPARAWFWIHVKKTLSLSLSNGKSKSLHVV